MSQSKPEAEQTPLFSLKWYFIQKKKKNHTGFSYYRMFAG